MRILMVGLDAAGKTTILYKLKLGEGESMTKQNFKMTDAMIGDERSILTLVFLWSFLSENDNDPQLLPRSPRLGSTLRPSSTRTSPLQCGM